MTISKAKVYSIPPTALDGLEIGNASRITYVQGDGEDCVRIEREDGQLSILRNDQLTQYQSNPEVAGDLKIADVRHVGSSYSSKVVARCERYIQSRKKDNVS